VGTVEVTGDRVQQFAVGDRVGVPWLGIPVITAATVRGRENLCDYAQYTGYEIDGG